MLAQNLAGRFEEWLADQERTRPWSLQGALFTWLFAEAPYWTNESYKLYLRMVAVTIANWGVHQENFTYQLNGLEAILKDISDDEGMGAHQNWECLDPDQYERAVRMRREEMGMSPPLIGAVIMER